MEMLETFENIKTPAINKSEVFGKLFGKLTIVTMDMPTFKAIITCSKMPTRGRQTEGCLILILFFPSPCPPCLHPREGGIPHKGWGVAAPGERGPCHFLGCLKNVRAGVGEGVAVRGTRGTHRANHMTDDAFGETEVKEAGVRNGTYGPNLVTTRLRERDLSWAWRASWKLAPHPMVPGIAGRRRKFDVREESVLIRD